MKHKKFLLVVFFLTLFVFQQVQASTKMPHVEKPSSISVAPASANILFPTVYVYIYKLDGVGSIGNPVTKCRWVDQDWTGIDYGYGCGTEIPVWSLHPSGTPQPYAENGLYYLAVEQDYLPNVIAPEMAVKGIPPELQALRAQAVASRTVVSWKSANGRWDKGNGVYGDGYPVEENGYPDINNSTEYQVYIPGSYASSPAKTAIGSAVSDTTDQYLSVGGHTIDAEFSSDFAVSEPEGSKNYLIGGIKDPITTTSNLPFPDGVCQPGVLANSWGMSQLGAIRWAKGNTCPDGTGTKWPVYWDYKQILAHYYTGVDFINDNTGNKIAPDYRWNLLNHDAPKIIQREPWAFDPITLTIQNTSAM